MACKKSKKLNPITKKSVSGGMKKYRKCVGSEMNPTTKRIMSGGVKGFRGSKPDAKKAFREAAQSCKKKLEDIV